MSWGLVKVCLKEAIKHVFVHFMLTTVNVGFCCFVLGLLLLLFFRGGGRKQQAYPETFPLLCVLFQRADMFRNNAQTNLGKKETLFCL